MTDLKLYLIRNGEGKYSTGGYGPTWSNKPKVWTQRGHAIAALRYALKNKYRYGETEEWHLPPEDWQLVEVNVDFTSSQLTSVKTIAEAQNRSLICKNKHGDAFAALVDTIEDKGEELVWQWVLCMGTYHDSSAGTNMVDQLKNNKLKKNSDYRMVHRGGRYAFAFKNKSHASMMRLSSPYEITSIDIKNFIEVDLIEIDADTNVC